MNTIKKELDDPVYRQYSKHVQKRNYFIIVSAFLLVFCLFFSVFSGSSGSTFANIKSLFTNSLDQSARLIIYNIRLPRTLAGVLSGAVLAVTGAVLQSLLRNPLVAPSTLGITSSAAFGAAFSIVFFGSGFTAVPALNSTLSTTTETVFHNPSPLPTLLTDYLTAFSAFTFSSAAILMILWLIKLKKASPETIILSGIAIGSLFSAGITTLQYFADSIQLGSIVFWMFGDLGRAVWKDIYLLLSILLLVLLYFILNIWNYKAVRSGDDYARSIGINPDKMRLSGMLICSFATAAIVSLYGIIAFIGLIVPHIVRLFTGSDEKFLIPASAVFGSFFLLLCDTISRTLFSPIILPVGILTSFIGVPVFLFILIKK